MADIPDKPSSAQPPRASTRAAAASPKRAVASPAASPAAAEGLATIKTLAEIPGKEIIYTAAGQQFEISNHQHRENLIAIGLTSGSVWICVDPAFYNNGKFHVSTLREKMRAAGLKVEKTVYADAKLIGTLYQSSSMTSDDKRGDEEMPPEGILFDEFVRYGIKNRATDMHFESRGQDALVKFRINGLVEPMANEFNGSYTRDQLVGAIGYAFNRLQAKGSGSHSNFSTETKQSCMIPYLIDGKPMNLRYQSSPRFVGLKVVIRFLSSTGVKTAKYEELGYADDQREMLDLAARTRTGMVLLVGVTGSGKSTTLRTVVNNIPGKEELAIYTVEDPVEEELSCATQISVQRTLNQSSDDKAPMKELEGVLMRMDPDTIMVGEIRDKESGASAQTFLETGHQVLATLHAASALGAFPRLLSDQVGFTKSTVTSKGFWSLIVYQALVPVLCECKLKASDVIPEVLEKIVYRFGVATDDMCVKNPNGCPKCKKRGTIGQTVVAEMVYPNRKILEYIRSGNDFEAEKAWRQTSDKKLDSPNMTGKNVWEHAMYKAYIGTIDIREVEKIEAFDRVENIWET